MTFSVTAAELARLGLDRYAFMPDDIVWSETGRYDENNHRTESTDIYGNTTYYEYDASGNVTQTTDHNGNVTTNAYDTRGRLVKTTDPNGNVTEYVHSDFGMKSVTLYGADGSVTVLSQTDYDNQGRVWRTTDQTGRVTEYAYTLSGQQRSVTQKITDANGVTHTLETYNTYDAKHRLTSTTRYEDGVEVSRVWYEYNSNGQTAAEVDQDGLRTEYIYDSRGQTTETRRQTMGSDGVKKWLISRTVYDALGNVVWESYDTLEGDVGKATYYLYDALGRVIRTEERKGVVFAIDAEGNSSIANTGSLVSYSAQAYDGAGRTAWTENSHGVKTVYVYTREGDVSYTITDMDGDLSTTSDQTAQGKTEYDEQGRQTTNTLDRDGNLDTTGDQSSTLYVYDNHGRVIETIYADGTKTSVTYDSLGRKASETDQLGNTTRFEYDAQGRLTAVVLPQVKHPETGEMVHVRYEYAYDAQGNQISLKDNIFQTDAASASTIDRSASRETRFTYDWLGRQTSRTLPDGLTEYFFYNAEGQTTRQISFEGRVTVYEYDDLGRLAKKLFFTSKSAWNNGNGISGHTITYTYDSLGRIIREVDSKTGTTETTYNADGQVSRISSPTGIINYEYDSITGQVTRTWTGTDSSSPITDVRNTYDKLGRLETVETYAREGALLTNPEIARYVYDVIGNLDKIHHSNGILTDYNYDLLNRLQEVKHIDTQGTESTADDVIVEEFEYTYHANGNKSGEVAIDKDGNLNTWNWDYDALGRLIKERHDNHDNTLDYATDYIFGRARIFSHISEGVA